MTSELKNVIGKEINKPTFVAWMMGFSLEGEIT